MVLQQGTSLPIWGEADPGERVTVKFVSERPMCPNESVAVATMVYAPSADTAVPDVNAALLIVAATVAVESFERTTGVTMRL